MGKAAFDHTLKLTPEQRAAGAERARGLRLFGERLGLNKLRNSGVAEELKAGTALPRPQEPTQQRKRKRAAGGGAKRKLSDDVVEHGKKFVRGELDLQPGWASNFQACCVHVKEKLKLPCRSWQTVGTWIVKPVLIERGLWKPIDGPFEK